MNKSAVFMFVILATVVITAYSAPIEEEFKDQEKKGSGHVIQKRATCDLLSFEVAGVKLNDSACAAHCLTLGKKGGYCNGNKICVCRN